MSQRIKIFMVELSARLRGSVPQPLNQPKANAATVAYTVFSEGRNFLLNCKGL